MLKGKSKTSIFLILFTLIALLGFVDSLHLTVSHFEGVPPTCTFLEGCELVTSSEYATWGSFPVALAGSIYYLLLFFLSITYLSVGNKKFLKFGLYITPIGVLASAWFVYLQIFVINAICFYCMVSALTSTLLLIFAIILIRKGLNNI